MIPRGRYLGKRLGDPPKDEADHFIRCPVCDGWIDCRDLGHVLEHEGPLPHELSRISRSDLDRSRDIMDREVAPHAAVLLSLHEREDTQG